MVDSVILLIALKTFSSIYLCFSWKSLVNLSISILMRTSLFIILSSNSSKSVFSFLLVIYYTSSLFYFCYYFPLKTAYSNNLILSSNFLVCTLSIYIFSSWCCTSFKHGSTHWLTSFLVRASKSINWRSMAFTKREILRVGRITYTLSTFLCFRDKN